MSLPAVHHYPVTVLEREIEDLKDDLASITDNGEYYPGEAAEIQARLQAAESHQWSQQGRWASRPRPPSTYQKGFDAGWLAAIVTLEAQGELNQ